MRKGWEIKKLADVVDFQRGLTYSKKDEVDFSDNIVLRSNNVSLITNKLDFSELKYI
jgi:type I restriction enzyme S subunit